jgi:hypothetical protein
MSKFLRHQKAALISFCNSSMAYGRSRQLDIAFFRHTVRDTVPRPSKPLRVADALLARRSLRPTVTSAAVPTTSAARPIAGDLGKN